MDFHRLEPQTDSHGICPVLALWIHFRKVETFDTDDLNSELMAREV
jgi:hypothetical protein